MRVSAPYEDLLSIDLEWALSEGSRHFEESSAVHQALRSITSRLSQLDIPYAVVGGMALFRHGFRRFTEDVDLLVTRDGLKKIHESLEGLGYLPPFPKSKNLRDTELGVRIEFLIAGQFPGDGKPKPVAFPDPERSSFDDHGIRYLTLPALIELKLASGISDGNRMKDLADVQELIKLLSLPSAFATQLNAYVQPKFNELWQGVHGGGKRYILPWKLKSPLSDGATIDDLISFDPDSGRQLDAMRSDGVTLESSGRAGSDFVYLVTTDPDIAQKHGMHDESEYWDDDGIWGNDGGTPRSPV